MLWGAVKEDPVIGWGPGVEEVVVGGWGQGVVVLPFEEDVSVYQG